MNKELNEIDSAIELFDGTQFDVHYCAMEDVTTVLDKSGGWQLEFLLSYTYETKSYSPATLTDPEDFELEFIPLSHSQICLYNDSGAVELSNVQLKKLDDIIIESLYN